MQEHSIIRDLLAGSPACFPLWFRLSLPDPQLADCIGERTRCATRHALARLLTLLKLFNEFPSSYGITL